MVYLRTVGPFELGVSEMLNEQEVAHYSLSMV